MLPKLYDQPFGNTYVIVSKIRGEDQRLQAWWKEDALDKKCRLMLGIIILEIGFIEEPQAVTYWQSSPAGSSR